jgi:hypothetical protein
MSGKSFPGSRVCTSWEMTVKRKVHELMKVDQNWSLKAAGFFRQKMKRYLGSI